MNSEALMAILLLINQNNCRKQYELRDMTPEELLIGLALCVLLFFVLNYFVNKLLGE